MFLNTLWPLVYLHGFAPMLWCLGLSCKEFACNVGDAGYLSLIPGSGTSPGGGNSNPLHILAWEIPWTEEPDSLQFMASQSQT